MKRRITVAILFMTIAIVLAVVYYSQIVTPDSLEAYFKADYFNQLGPIAICVELFIAGYYLFIKHAKANFALALFGFTALLDPFFNFMGLFSSSIPVLGMIIFGCCALLSLWLAFTDTFGLGRISLLGALGSFILGNAVELFFNYL